MKETVSGKSSVNDETCSVPNNAKRADGQYVDHQVLCDEERSKGFVRPVRKSYRHLTCGTITTMPQAIAETYARMPNFYGRTFCCCCGDYFPVGEKGEFVWLDTEEKVGT